MSGSQAVFNGAFSGHAEPMASYVPQFRGTRGLLKQSQPIWEIMIDMAGGETIPSRTVRNIVTRDYVVAFLAFFGFLAAYHALTPTLPMYLDRLGSNDAEIGTLVGIIGVASLVSRLLVGKILLRYSERSVMMAGAMLFAFSFLALITFRPFWPFLLVRLFQGIAFASLDTSAIAYVVRITPDAYRARAISYFLLAPSLASAIAATSGVLVVNAYGFSFLLLACSGLSWCAFLLSWKLKVRRIETPIEISPVRNDKFLEWKILAPAVMSFLFYFSWAGVRAFFPLYSLECGVTNPGFFFSANAIMVVAVRLLGGKIFDLYGKEKIIPSVMLVVMAAVVTLSFSTTLPMFIVIGLVWGAATAFLIPASMAYALEFADSSSGSAIGTYQAFMDLGVAVGPVTAGLLLPHTGYRFMFLSLALMCLANLCHFLFYLKKRGSVTTRT
jgi:MFS family permease